jgi:hypothetical protein
MLTATQRQWAEGQVGEDRDAVLDGTVTETTQSRERGVFEMTVTADNGTATHRARMTNEQAGAHRDARMSVRIDGTVDRIEYDEPNGRVGLVVVADNGTVTEWVVPGMSDDEKAAQETARQAERDQIDAEERERELAQFKQRVLDLVNSDADVRAALRAVVDSV